MRTMMINEKSTVKDRERQRESIGGKFRMRQMQGVSRYDHAGFAHPGCLSAFSLCEFLPSRATGVTETETVKHDTMDGKTHINDNVNDPFPTGMDTLLLERSTINQSV